MEYKAFIGSTSTSKAPARVLVVDDMEFHRQLASSVLTKEGFEVTGAADGRSCLSILERGSFNLILLDINLPDINGLELCRRIKADPRYERILVIFLTGERLDDDSREEAVLSEGDGYITRPISSRSLVSLVRMYLRLQRVLAQVHARELEFERLVDSVQFGIWTLDANGNTLFVNPVIAHLLGYSRDEMAGRPFSSFIDDSSDVDNWTNLSGRLDAGISEFEVGLRNRRGERIRAMLSISSLANERGEYLGAVMGVADITERKQIEAALRKSETRYHALFDQMGAAVVIMKDAQCIECNSAAARLYGVSGPEKLIGKTPLDFAPERQPDGALSADVSAQYVRRVLEGSTEIFEWTSRRADGIFIQTEVRLSSVCVGDELFLQSIITDITKRKKWEEKLYKANAQLLAEVAERLRVERSLQEVNSQMEERVKERTAELRRMAAQLTEAQRLAGMGNWELDLGTGRLTWSDEIFRIFEIDKERFEASYEALLAAIHPEERSTVDAAYRRSLETRSPYNITYRLLMPDGRVKHVHEQCETHYDEEGRALRSVGTVQDITAQKVAEEKQARQMQELARADRLSSIGVLVAGVAHEINNPNSFVHLNSQNLEKYWALIKTSLLPSSSVDPQLMRRIESFERMIGDIRTGSERITRIVANLKSFSQPRVSQKIEKVSVKEVVEKAWLIAGAHVRKKVKSHAVELEDVIPELLGDQLRLEQMLINLLVNAADAVEGLPESRLKISARVEDSTVRISVWDNGPAIPAEDRARVFEPFFSTKQDGTGLGLAIVASVVKDHGGHVEIEDPPEGGCLFTVFLPVSGGVS